MKANQLAKIILFPAEACVLGPICIHCQVQRHSWCTTTCGLCNRMETSNAAAQASQPHQNEQQGQLQAVRQPRQLRA